MPRSKAKKQGVIFIDPPQQETASPPPSHPGTKIQAPDLSMMHAVDKKINKVVAPLKSLVDKQQTSAQKEEKGAQPTNKSGKDNLNKLTKLAGLSEEIIFRVKSVFPFNFFPDEVIIDKSKVNVVSRIFFMSGNVRSVPFDEVSDVTVDFGPIFATLTIQEKYFKGEPYQITYLKKEEARKARRIIDGMRMAKIEGVDFTEIPTHEILLKAEELGRAEEIPDLS